MLIDAERSCLLVIDIQSKLLPAMAEPERVVANTAVLLKAAQRLHIPVLVSEQNPRGLGPTVPELALLLPAESAIEKLHFSCLRDHGFAKRLREIGRRQAVLTGIEAHVCVLQTALDLLVDGADVFVVADATSSRLLSSQEIAFERMRQAGVRVVTTEMVLFEWLRRAGTPEFKDLSALIK